MVNVGLVALVIHLMSGDCLNSMNFSSPAIPTSPGGLPGHRFTTTGGCALKIGVFASNRRTTKNRVMGEAPNSAQSSERAFSHLVRRNASMSCRKQGRRSAFLG